MTNCYEILGVRTDATLAEIKKAYREKVKQFHPDLRGDDSKNSEFAAVIKAYKILSDARARSVFDDSFFVRVRRSSTSDSFDYYTWLSEREDEESRAKLIFFTLTNQREDEAVAEFKRMQTEHSGFSLKRWFSREDFMDYGYILAEELVLRKEYYDAFLLLEQIIQLENSFHYFRIFAQELMAFALKILQSHIDGVISDELALDVYERALELNFGSKSDAFFLKKMAGEYTRLGDFYTAELCMRQSALLSRS